MILKTNVILDDMDVNRNFLKNGSLYEVSEFLFIVVGMLQKKSDVSESGERDCKKHKIIENYE